MNRHIIISLAVVAVAVTLLFAAAREAVFWWPVIEYQPVCHDHSRWGPRSNAYDVRSLEGKPTPEFWELLLKESRVHDLNKDYRGYALRDGKLLISLAHHWNILQDHGKGEDAGSDRDIMMWGIPETILNRRIAEGRFGSPERERFSVRLDRRSMARRPLRAGECGLVEELIIQGGSLTGPPPD